VSDHEPRASSAFTVRIESRAPGVGSLIGALLDALTGSAGPVGAWCVLIEDLDGRVVQHFNWGAGEGVIADRQVDDIRRDLSAMTVEQFVEEYSIAHGG
jgi:hypothetical protein